MFMVDNVDYFGAKIKKIGLKLQEKLQKQAEICKNIYKNRPNIVIKSTKLG
jgi:hypothetical protein